MAKSALDLHCLFLMATARKAMKATVDSTEKKIPTQKKILSPFSQVLQ